MDDCLERFFQSLKKHYVIFIEFKKITIILGCHKHKFSIFKLRKIYFSHKKKLLLRFSNNELWKLPSKLHLTLVVLYILYIIYYILYIIYYILYIIYYILYIIYYILYIVYYILYIIYYILYIIHYVIYYILYIIY